MPAALSKNALDIGIVVTNAERSLAFYRDLLGFQLDEKKQLPGGGVQYRLKCGASLVKLVALAQPPAAKAPAGGAFAATGYRYFTIFVSNLEPLVQECKDAGYKIAREISKSPIFPNRIAMVEDPDGNWVEFFESG